MSATAYIVLRLGKGEEAGQEVWELCGSADASNAETAIRKVATAAGTYVATPARSFRPVAVAIETVTALKLAPTNPADYKAASRENAP